MGDSNWLIAAAPKVARQLIGWGLYRQEDDGTLTGGQIIETEAYQQTDEASHSYRGLTLRTKPMFAAAGTLYVYRSYGLHWCLNIVTGPVGEGAAVLIRALHPDAGMENMHGRRGRADHLVDGPGKVAQALGVTGALSGQALGHQIILVRPSRPIKASITSSPRVGITRNVNALWRFTLDQEKRPRKVEDRGRNSWEKDGG